ncbi:MAG: tetratricopeptide repeat protein, partial [bacterium]|nr:tetratricopeptide repeat protein [bacterium]
MFFFIFEKLIRSYSQNRTLLLVIEDFHWIDDSSINLFKYLIKNLMDRPIFFLFIARPEIMESVNTSEFITDLEREDFFRSIRIEQLTKEESMVLVEKILEIEKIPIEFKELIIKHSEGNPFFTEEIIKSFIDEGILIRSGENWKAAKTVESLNIPSSVEGVIRSRLDNLPDKEKKIIQNAAIIGKIFWYNILESITDFMVNDSLESLEDKDLVVKKYNSEFLEDTEYYFKHILIQEIAYKSILQKIRKQVHKNIAEELEKKILKGDQFIGLLAYHFEQAGIFNKAAEYYLTLAKSQKGKNLNNEALESFLKVTEWKDEIPFIQYFHAVTGISSIYSVTGENRKAIQLLNELLKITSGDDLTAAIYQSISENFQRISDYRSSLEYLEKEDKLINRDNFNIRIKLLNSFAWIYYLLGENEKLRKYAERALEVFEENKTKLNYDEGMDLQTRIFNLLGVYYGEVGEYTRALNYYKMIEEAYLRNNKFLFLDACYNNLGTIYSSLGEYSKASECYLKSNEISRLTGDRLGEAITLNNIGDIYLISDDFEKAEETYKKYLKINEEIENKLGNGYGNAGLGRVELRRKNYKLSEEYFLNSIRIFHELGSKNLELSTKLELAECYLENTRTEETLTLISEVKKEIEEKDVYFIQGIKEIEGKIAFKEERIDDARKIFEELLQVKVSLGELESVISIGKIL